MPGGERLRRSPSVAWVESEARVALVRLDDLAAAPLALEDSGAAVWLCLDDAPTPDELTARVAEDYGVEPAVVAADVARFVEELCGSGLVERLP